MPRSSRRHTALSPRFDSGSATANSPDRAVCDTVMLEALYRLALCLTANESVAADICIRLLQSVRARPDAAPMDDNVPRLLRELLRDVRRLRAVGAILSTDDTFPELEALTSEQREVVALEIVFDLSGQECAHVLHVSVQQVNTWKLEARRGVAAYRRMLPTPDPAVAHLHRRAL